MYFVTLPFFIQFIGTVAEKAQRSDIYEMMRKQEKKTPPKITKLSDFYHTLQTTTNPEVLRIVSIVGLWVEIFQSCNIKNVIPTSNGNIENRINYVMNKIIIKKIGSTVGSFVQFEI